MVTLLDSEAKATPARSRPNPSEVGRRGRAIYARDLQESSKRSTATVTLP